MASRLAALASWAHADAVGPFGNVLAEIAGTQTAAADGVVVLEHLIAMSEAIISGDTYAETIHANGAYTMARLAAENAGFASAWGDVLGWQDDAADAAGNAVDAAEYRYEANR